LFNIAFEGLNSFTLSEKNQFDAKTFDVFCHQFRTVFVQNAGQNTVGEFHNGDVMHFFVNAFRTFSPIRPAPIISTSESGPIAASRFFASSNVINVNFCLTLSSPSIAAQTVWTRRYQQFIIRKLGSVIQRHRFFVGSNLRSSFPNNVVQRFVS
jgi:hypothetical protein